MERTTGFEPATLTLAKRPDFRSVPLSRAFNAIATPIAAPAGACSPCCVGRMLAKAMADCRDLSTGARGEVHCQSGRGPIDHALVKRVLVHSNGRRLERTRGCSLTLERPLVHCTSVRLASNRTPRQSYLSGGPALLFPAETHTPRARPHADQAVRRRLFKGLVWPPRRARSAQLRRPALGR
jgi:hypothetical protein